MSLEKRRNQRKNTMQLRVGSISAMDSTVRISRGGVVVNVSPAGLMLVVSRHELVPKFLRSHLTLESLVGDSVRVHLADMDLELSGTITRTRFLGRRGFQLVLDFSEEEPLFWRECLFDLMPQPGELEE